MPVVHADIARRAGLPMCNPPTAAEKQQVDDLLADMPGVRRRRGGLLVIAGETTVDEVLTRELEDVACAHAEELSEALPGFANAFAWP